MPGILGKKLGMTRLIQDDGRVIPFTVVECEPNEIVQVKTTEKDGYPAVVLGFSKLHKPAKNKKFHFVREFRVDGSATPKMGDFVTVDLFQENETVKITAVSKGKGFQGVVKKYHFAGGCASHGSHNHREPGSIGARAKPGRVCKGKKLPGRMGGETITIRETQVVYLNKDKNLIGIKGQIPGGNGHLVIIRKQ
ncbi:MAG: 50S ribosomal protein L3 [Candidatus Gracilibacteria bacterium]|jgi:large subunit ribosomal protein L3